MRQLLVSYLRLLAASIAVFAVAACVRLAPAHAATSPEPRLGDAPPAGQLAAAGRYETDEERISALEARLADLEAEIVHLRKALDVLGPLPDHPDLFIPVALSELDERPKPAIHILYAGPGLGCFAPLAATPPAVTVGAGYVGLDDSIHLSGDTALNALCVELSAIAGPARIVAPIRAW